MPCGLVTKGWLGPRMIEGASGYLLEVFVMASEFIGAKISSCFDDAILGRFMQVLWWL